MTVPDIIIDFPLDNEGSEGRVNSAGPRPRRPLAFAEPREILLAEQTSEVRAVLRAAEARARAGAWVVGFVAYDAAPAFDVALQIPGRQTDLPLAWFAVFDAPLAAEKTTTAATEANEASDSPVKAEQPHAAGPWQASIDATRFAADIARLRQHIHDGDAYQINHTLRLHAPFNGDALALFARLRRAQPDGYCSYLNLGTQQILSASPELFFRRDGDVIKTQPMKGTVRRGRWAAEDRQLAEWLQHSEKNRAENLMIVDLLRNDLSRIALPHSVAVTDLFAVERHPTLWQMTSTVSATARPDTSLDTLFAALFPCGSVSGAPKAKAMELIATLETEPRGIYCGAIGLLRPGGDALFSVAIRTVAINHHAATCGIGAGITWDSTASDEHAETLLKARFLDVAAALPPATTQDFGLFETLRLENGTYWLLERHLARLAGSADYFVYPYDDAACRTHLTHLAGKHAQGRWRVRLDLAPDGSLATTISPMPATPARPVFALATTAVPRDALWLHHKTTRRDAYEDALALALALASAQATQTDIFDVLLHNESGELTEFTRGNLVVELDGIRYTPPLDCGLLDGVLRRELLETGQLHERVLMRTDLDRAERILFINSLRGEVEVRLMPQT